MLGVIFWYVLTYHKDDLSVDGIQLWLTELGGSAPITFIIIYAVSTILFLPGVAITLLGGFLFGPFWGTLYNLIGATLGALAAFLLARFILGNWVGKTVKGKVKILKEGVEKGGWKFIAIVRLMPVLPFNVLNYTLGLTNIKALTYTVTSFFFMLPGCFVYTYIGSLGDDIVAGNVRDLAGKIFISVGMLLFLICVPWVIRKLKEAD